MNGTTIALLAGAGGLLLLSRKKSAAVSPSAGKPAAQSATGTNQPGVATDIGSGIGSALKSMFGSGGGKSAGGGSGGPGMSFGGGGGGGGPDVAPGMASQGVFPGAGDSSQFQNWFGSEQAGNGGFQLTPGGNLQQQPLNVEQIGQGSAFTLEPMQNPASDTFGTSLTGGADAAAPFDLSLDGGNSNTTDPFGLNLGLDTSGSSSDGSG